MGVDFLYILGGLVLLVLGAEGLVRGSVSLARRAGLTPLVIGLTVVALGTSSPELVVSVQAALTGRGGLALGNVVGSNISNIALILGLAVLIRPAAVRRQLLRFDVPVLLGCSLLLGVALLTGAQIGRVEGGAFLLGLAVYTAVAVRAARREPDATPPRTEFAQTVPAPPNEAAPEESARSTGRDVLLTLGGVALLVAGGRLLVSGAVSIGRWAGMEEAVIGLTIVAVGTSLPELATSVVAALRNQPDIALGNVVGSNLLNILCVLGFTALIEPLPAGGLHATDVGVMLAITLLLLPLMRTRFELARWEGGLLLALYAAYLAYLL